jgi:hypothetical protein
MDLGIMWNLQWAFFCSVVGLWDFWIGAHVAKIGREMVQRERAKEAKVVAFSRYSSLSDTYNTQYKII